MLSLRSLMLWHKGHEVMEPVCSSSGFRSPSPKRNSPGTMALPRQANKQLSKVGYGSGNLQCCPEPENPSVKGYDFGGIPVRCSKGFPTKEAGYVTCAVKDQTACLRSIVARMPTKVSPTHPDILKPKSYSPNMSKLV